MPNHFSHAPNVELVLGSYTGDGTTSHAITGLGGKPKSLEIFDHPTAEVDSWKFEKLDRDWGEFTFFHAGIAGNHRMALNQIISLDEDGFTVSDAGQDFDPNRLGKVYDFIAIV